MISQDTALQWQMPLGTLPFPSNISIHTENVNNSIGYGTPTSLDERVSCIGSIPPGGNDQALIDIRSMVANSFSSLNAAIDGTSINSVFLDESLHIFFLKFIPTFPVLHRSNFLVSRLHLSAPPKRHSDWIALSGSKSVDCERRSFMEACTRCRGNFLADFDHITWTI